MQDGLGRVPEIGEDGPLGAEDTGRGAAALRPLALADFEAALRVIRPAMEEAKGAPAQ